MKTRWFTFGQVHIHRVNGKVFDKDCVVRITAKEPRDIMVKHFGAKWAFEYDNEPDMHHFPRGVFDL